MEELSSFVTNESEVLQAISELNMSSSPGPDGMTCEFLSKCRHSLAPVLTLLFNKSYSQASFTDILKMAHITLLFKGGDTSDPACYRPVSLTSNIARISEKVSRRKVIEHLVKNHLMPHSQHGFVENHSTMTQLIEHLDSIIRLLDESEAVDVVYLDFAKAFDKLDHRLLIQRLGDLGIVGKARDWIKSFLMDRTQRVKVDGKLSDEKRVISGMPQGTILGPLLFILFISPMSNIPQCSMISSFADDTKIIAPRSANLQKDLNDIYDWVHSNNMEFNGSKFRVVSNGGGDIKSQRSIGQSYRGSRNCS